MLERFKKVGLNAGESVENTQQINQNLSGIKF